MQDLIKNIYLNTENNSYKRDFQGSEQRLTLPPIFMHRSSLCWHEHVKGLYGDSTDPS